MKKGFTLIELLIVIGIIGVLSTTTVVILNPAELLKQTRDVQRINDLKNIISAMNLYVLNSGDIDLNGSYANERCGDRTYVFGTNVNDGGIGPLNYSFNGNPAEANNRNHFVCQATRGTSGGSAGWFPVNLSNMDSGSPLSILPVDPLRYIDQTDYVYRYACDNNTKTYELNACLESVKYSNFMVNDAGDKNIGAPCVTGGQWYEVGNRIDL